MIGAIATITTCGGAGLCLALLGGADLYSYARGHTTLSGTRMMLTSGVALSGCGLLLLAVAALAVAEAMG